ncbi:MAG: PD40 domain-containing protein, partial [Chloroflexi bacterium]|nr:PD40 domain-containing protein [Chloroflexota bacterium]
ALRGDERLTIWDLASGRLEQDAPSQASILAVRPDGAQIALGGRGVVRLLDLAGAETRRYSVGMGEEIAGLAYSPDGSSLAVFARVGSLDFERMRFNVQVWRDAVRVGSFSCWMRPYFPTAAWSADGRWLAYIARSVEHRGDEAWLWSAESGATRLVTSVETSQIFQLDWAPAAPILAYDLLRNDLGTGATFLFDATSHRELARFDDGMGPRFVPDGSRLLVGGGGILDVRMREYAVDPKATPPTPTVATPSPVPTTATPTPPSATPTRTTATHTPTPTGPANPDLLLPSLLAGAPLR